MNSKGIFVTGSTTGVGKTYVSALLLRAFSKLGVCTTYMKPVETGCSDEARQTDTEYALHFATCQVDGNLHSPYKFARACSPHLAAKIESCEIRMSEIALAYRELAQSSAADIIVVEGAGGVLVPINDNEYIIDVIKTLNIPALLVTEPCLGTLNHTFMSLRVLKQQGVSVCGIVINNARGIARDFIYEDNVKTIRERTNILCLDLNFSADSSTYEYDENGASAVEVFCRKIMERV